MPDINFAKLFGPVTVTEPTSEEDLTPGGCQCPLSGTRAYELTVDAGSIFLTCISCGESVDTDLLDLVNTAEIGLPVTITWAMESGGYGEPDELWGTLTSRETSGQGEAEEKPTDAELDKQFEHDLDQVDLADAEDESPGAGPWDDQAEDEGGLSATELWEADQDAEYAMDAADEERHATDSADYALGFDDGEH